ncbi:hypothetical protein ZWY2020_049884 [Hordeum vulgare]|nr:hypothetical protein ZWY2020_049884 [Hordeum vulgare]
MHFDGNVLSIEPVEEAERCVAVFDELIELEAIGIPHELWHDAGIKFVLSHFGDVCSVDQYYMQGDYTSVRALVMVAAGLPTPESMVIRLPISQEVKSVALKVMQRSTHGVNANPFAGSSEDSISTRSSVSGCPIAGGWAGPDTIFPHAPPPSPTPTSPPPATLADGLVDTSPLTPAHTDADFCTLPSAVSGPTSPANATSPSAGGSAFVPFAPASAVVSLEPMSTAFTFEASSSHASPLPVNDLDMHELHINKASVAVKRARRYADKAKRSAELLRRSDRLARKEPRVYTSMVARASKVKVARLGDDGPATTFLDAIHASGLDDPAAPPAPPAALALLAKLCGADSEQVNSVRNADTADDPVVLTRNRSTHVRIDDSDVVDNGAGDVP